MMKINKTHIAQIVLITFLGFALIAPIAPADADTPGDPPTIVLQGEIAPANIDISITPGNLNLDIATGATEASDAITVTSTSQIPVAMTLVSFSYTGEEGRWSPTLITGDPCELGVVDAQKQARFTLIPGTGESEFYISPTVVAPPAIVTPTGKGDTVDGTTYPVYLGTIADTNGTDSKSVDITGKLEVSKKRIVSKAFDAKMVLNFAIPDANG